MILDWCKVTVVGLAILSVLAFSKMAYADTTQCVTVLDGWHIVLIPVWIPLDELEYKLYPGRLPPELEEPETVPCDSDELVVGGTPCVP